MTTQTNSEENTFTISLEHKKDYEFNVKFEGSPIPDLLVDEKPPLGKSVGPNPSAMIATGVANCLSASLLFCLNKSHVKIDELKSQAKTTMTRNEKGRLRIGKIEVTIDLKPTKELSAESKTQRCATLFEDFCVVTESIRKGIPVDVKINGIEPKN